MTWFFSSGAKTIAWLRWQWCNLKSAMSKQGRWALTPCPPRPRFPLPHITRLQRLFAMSGFHLNWSSRDHKEANLSSGSIPRLKSRFGTSLLLMVRMKPALQRLPKGVETQREEYVARADMARLLTALRLTSCRTKFDMSIHSADPLKSIFFNVNCFSAGKKVG